jgi:hypothetical protein
MFKKNNEKFSDKEMKEYYELEKEFNDIISGNTPKQQEIIPKIYKKTLEELNKELMDDFKKIEEDEYINYYKKFKKSVYNKVGFAKGMKKKLKKL